MAKRQERLAVRQTLSRPLTEALHSYMRELAKLSRGHDLAKDILKRTGCARGSSRLPHDRAHAAGGRRPDRYRSSPRAPAGDRGARPAGGPLRSWYVCRESLRPQPLPPGRAENRPVAQDFSELILDVSWLNQLDDVIFGHGISLLRWRSGGVKHPHDMPPFRFPPSPTLGDSSMKASLMRGYQDHDPKVPTLIEIKTAT